MPPRIEPDLRLMSLLSTADRALGELAGIGRRLRNPHLLIRPFIRREAVLSSRIEGTITRLDQLFLFEAQPEEPSHPSDAGEVRNYVRALEHGLEYIRGGEPFSLRMLREIHHLLLDGVRGAEKRPGELRDRAVLIGRSSEFDEARFIPPCHTTIGPMLDDFVAFLRDERSLPVAIQLALAHYQFETIHPFNDGNGRVGRLLITLMLCERQILPQPLLYLSAFFEQHREEYYDHLLNVSRRAAWNDWFGFFARAIAEQARDAVIRVQRLQDLQETLRQRTSRLIRTAAPQILVDELFASPFITMNRAADVMGVAFKSAARTIITLEEAGILREITGQQRNRVYCADEILRLLDEPLTDDPPTP
ncbi:Fic family protein [Planctomyces sp. SH-PL62]|uniref:Fic family protein n=1 Tax=Planctomyces sp. SH-PL62 TaxID=1636152 RepID=UPI0018D2CEBB|nr:Fic family protein [Planctomyces sp. SH-PL62]